MTALRARSSYWFHLWYLGILHLSSVRPDLFVDWHRTAITPICHTAECRSFKLVQRIMIWQSILESGLLKVSNNVSLILLVEVLAIHMYIQQWYDTRKTAPGLNAPARLSNFELNGLQVVEVTYEASRFCQEILFLPVPRLDPPNRSCYVRSAVHNGARFTTN